MVIRDKKGKNYIWNGYPPHIKTRFHVYSLSQTSDNPFIHDTGTEYYALKPIKIVGDQIFDTAEEIKRLGYEVYVLDKPLKSVANIQAGNNFDVQAEMEHTIRAGGFHRIDVDSVIRQQQSQGMLHRILSNIFQKS